MYETILVPTDGSDASMVAVEEGVEIAARFDATVHFLHVVDLGTEMSSSAVGDIADDLSRSLQETATEALDAAMERADAAGVDADRTTLEGFPHEAIADYGDDHDVDCIVVGASGRSGLTEKLLGSTTDRVIRSVDRSVLVARD